MNASAVDRIWASSAERQVGGVVWNGNCRWEPLQGPLQVLAAGAVRVAVRQPRETDRRRLPAWSDPGRFPGWNHCGGRIQVQSTEYWVLCTGQSGYWI